MPNGLTGEKRYSILEINRILLILYDSRRLIECLNKEIKLTVEKNFEWEYYTIKEKNNAQITVTGNAVVRKNVTALSDWAEFLH